MKSCNRETLTTLFPENIAVAIKLREGVSPQEVVERILRKYMLHTIDLATFRSIEEDVETELRKYGVFVVASVYKDADAPHGVVVSLQSLSEDS